MGIYYFHFLSIILDKQYENSAYRHTLIKLQRQFTRSPPGKLYSYFRAEKVMGHTVFL
jgi:hypothetical protein